jgi:uncharacterized protein YciI
MNNSQYTERRFVYVYFNRNEPEKIRQVVPAHVQYWNSANLDGHMGRTGGLITFVAASLQEATEIILQDPFILEDLIEQKWIKEWVPE